MELVTTSDQVRDAIAKLNEDLQAVPELANRTKLVHTWIIDATEPDKPKFGFSKWAGYVRLDAETYLNNYKLLNGRNTEWALKGLCSEIHPSSKQYRTYHRALSEWLAAFGKTPRNPVRLMVLEAEQEETADDRTLLDLLIAVADTLPLAQRHELRDRL